MKNKVFLAAAIALTALLHTAISPSSLLAQSPDSWDNDAANLTSSRSWIQRTTVTSANGSSYTRDVTFYDGLGYPIQESLVGASPVSAKTIVTPIIYDNMRRPDTRVNLPYSTPTTTAVFDSNADNNQSGYYLNEYLDSYPYTSKQYETSPEGRPISVMKPGSAWRTAGGGHKTTITYGTNATSDAVPRYRITPGANEASYVGAWPAGSLRCTQTTDEEGSVSRTFSDAFGRTVCTETLTGSGSQKARTLFIYDLRDSLCVVVQPEGTAALSNASPKDLSLLPASGTNHGITDKWCFVWSYDGWGNVLSEHTPGGGTTKYAYDVRNRLVLRTDDRMIPRDSSSSVCRMMFTLYDDMDRVTAEYYVKSKSGQTFEEQRAHFKDTVTHTMTGLSAFSTVNTIRTLKAVAYYPFTILDPSPSDPGAFVADAGFAESSDLNLSRNKGALKSETLYPAPDVFGNIPSGAPSVTRYYHYDSKGRVIQLKEVWSDGRWRRLSTKYSFVGDVLGTKETVYDPDEIDGTSSLATVYTRDSRGRVLTCSRTLNGTQTLEAVSYSYDDLGRMIAKSVGGGTPAKLKTTVGYDLRGWMTGTDVALATGSGNNTRSVFSESLYYAPPTANSNAGRYDGLVYKTAFSHGVQDSGNWTTVSNSWIYSYDGLKRLTGAGHFVGSSTTESLTDTEKAIGYDLNGNMTALKRYGSSGLQNDLSFSHTGNRMTALTDANATGSDAGQKAFSYDAGGNMTSDGRKGLDLSWNVLNLVGSAVTCDGSLTYAWLSDGTLTGVKADNGSGSVREKTYLGSYIVSSGRTGGITLLTSFESVGWDEGRIVLGGISPVDCWYAGDHLGNVRSVIDISPSQTVPQVLEQNDYLPFGTKIANGSFATMTANRWRYAGKEEQKFGSVDIGLLNFGARLYDPFSARWTAMDPLARATPGYSPISYCRLNPIRYIDLFGLWSVTKDGHYQADKGDDAASFASTYNMSKEDAQLFLDQIGYIESDGSFCLPSATITDSQQRAFVPFLTSTLGIFDISLPSNPNLSFRLRTNDNPFSIKVYNSGWMNGNQFINKKYIYSTKQFALLKRIVRPFNNAILLFSMVDSVNNAKTSSDPTESFEYIVDAVVDGIGLVPTWQTQAFSLFYTLGGKEAMQYYVGYTSNMIQMNPYYHPSGMY